MSDLGILSSTGICDFILWRVCSSERPLLSCTLAYRGAIPLDHFVFAGHHHGDDGVAEVGQQLAFEEQRRVDDDVLVLLFEADAPELCGDGPEDVLVGDGGEGLALLRVGEDEVGEGGAIDGLAFLLGLEDADAEALDDEVVGGLAGFDDEASEFVAVDDLDLEEVFEVFADGGLAAADAA